MRTAKLKALFAMSLIGFFSVSCTKDGMVTPNTSVNEDEGVAKFLGDHFIQTGGGFTRFMVSNNVYALGEFGATPSGVPGTPHYANITAEGLTDVKVGFGGNYPAQDCDGPPVDYNGFRFLKGSLGNCGATYYIRPLSNSSSGKVLKLRLKGGAIPDISDSEAWFKYVPSLNTWQAHPSASTYFCWSVVLAPPVPSGC